MFEAAYSNFEWKIIFKEGHFLGQGRLDRNQFMEPFQKWKQLKSKLNDFGRFVQWTEHNTLACRCFFKEKSMINFFRDDEHKNVP